MRIWSQCLLIAGLLSVSGVHFVSPAAADFDINRAKTEAKVMQDSRSGDLFVQIELRAELLDVPPEPIREALVVGWGEVGGATPDDGLEAMIPTGCSVGREGRFRVEDFDSCGVSMVLQSASLDRIVLMIREFEARLTVRRDGSASLTLEALFLEGSEQAAILDAIGGTPIAIAVGGESALAAASQIQNLMGIEPTPF